ncbi:MAG: Smr/MutS family protein, partial [bacterium]
ATVQQQPAIQTSQNTVDLRGMTAEEARHEVEAAVGSARAGAVLFVIHGVGTGNLRTSVLQSLRKNKRVRKTEQQEGSNGGCAVVYVS